MTAAFVSLVVPSFILALSFLALWNFFKSLAGKS